ncbi:uncharacterized protein LOC119408322 [Nematolebias whitei]|uniref:uncharacterized protein LOC119408322 n=1 Tax=Nematolebias whitei TaxID=451745 RepID=UPI00189C135A|nr:uncharacterized protein LOC119408322 [Nematolebias whitei]
MWRQQVTQRPDAAANDFKQELCRSGEKNRRRRNVLRRAVFNPDHQLQIIVVPADVQEMVPIKEEASEEWRPGVDQLNSEQITIKEEEEELWTSLEGEQLNVKEEADVTKFTFTAVPLKNEDDEEKPLFSQLHQHQVESRDLPSSSSPDHLAAAGGDEDCGGGETTRNPNLNIHEDDSSSSETEVSEDDEEEDDVNNPDSQLKHLSNSGSESEDSNNDWKESRAPESGVNTANKPLSCSECDALPDLTTDH